MQMGFRQFSRNNTYVSIPGKLSETHLHAWLFSNPCGKVQSVVVISWSPDLRVQHKEKVKSYLIVEISCDKNTFELLTYFNVIVSFIQNQIMHI